MTHLGKGNPDDVLYQDGSKNLVVGIPPRISAISGVFDYIVLNSGTLGSSVTTVAGSPIVADFETLSAAAAADNTLVEVIGDVTEVADVLIGASGLTIRMVNDPIITMGANKFAWSSDGSLATRGPAVISHTSTPLFEASGNVGRVLADGLEITNLLVSTGVLTNGSRGRFNGCVFNNGLRIDGTKNTVLGAEISSGIIFEATSENNMVSSCQLSGYTSDAGSGNIFSNIRVY